MKHFFEALERLFIKTYFFKMLRNFLLRLFIKMLRKVLDVAIEVVASFLEKYSKVKLQELKEKLVLANFGLSIFIWLKLYSNIFPQKLMAWEKTLPLCYASNKLHYARYSTHCIQHLQQLKKCHRGSLDESRSSMSIRRREFGIEQAIYIDLAGELTDMRNSKTTGIHPFQWVYFNFNIWFNCFLIKFSNLTRKICILKSWAQAPSWFRGDILIAVKISMGGKEWQVQMLV